MFALVVEVDVDGAVDTDADVDVDDVSEVEVVLGGPAADFASDFGSFGSCCCFTCA